MTSHELEALTKNLSFLFVEDDMDILEMLKAYFTITFRADVDGALDGDTAIRKIGEKHYDIISVDYTMWPIDGASLIEILREKQLVNESTTAIIAISTSGAWKEEAFRNLGVPHIIKPFDIREVSRIFRRELKRIGRIQ